ncbi:zinc-binding dehydrogenase [Streptomyces sp. NBC_00385]|uniref:zinc-binding dehydrogenase n=1 Tax=Streptomyces sp. NBC_00385 TaxID=2975733 RepID=UPI002DD96BAC|nr:zinc-binding dehydrogenase [Streptomyces sp. NBC_00385]WRZ08181.1 zinc-binding dehydrogenase [Streptomyces sp. NBC_00385]
MTDRTSRAVVLEGFGAPLAIREFPLPTAPPGGMVVASRYGGVCGTDLHLQQGHLDVPVPLVLGHEGLGTVHELGAGVGHDTHGTPLAVGDRVMWASSIACGTCVPCSAHLEPTLCERRRTYGVNRPVTDDASLAGSWAEHIELAAGTTVIRLPDGIEPLTAMSLACAGPTMAHAFERRPVRLGETVIVQGSGPVGLAAAALAQLGGARRVILAGGPAKRLGLAADLGIGTDHVDVVDAADQEAALAEVLALTGGRGADLVIECAGVPAAVGQGLRLARRGGSYLVVGQYTDSGDALINPHQIVHRQLDVIGSWAFTGAHLARYIGLLPELAGRFDLARLVTTYPLEDSASALRDVANGSALKAVLVS